MWSRIFFSSLLEKFLGQKYFSAEKFSDYASIDGLDIQVVPMREKITNEVKRFKLFQQSLLGIKAQISVKDIDIRNYAKFILQEGTMTEKRDFLGCLKTKIVLSNKKISLQ